MVVHEEVRRFDVSVDDVGRVKKPEGTKHIVQQNNDVVLLYFSVWNRVHHFAQVGLPIIHNYKNVVKIRYIQLHGIFIDSRGVVVMIRQLKPWDDNLQDPSSKWVVLEFGQLS